MTARFAIADDVAWVDAEDLGKVVAEVYVARVSGESPPIVLAGPAWAVWTAVADGGEDVPTVVSRVSELTGVSADDVAHDVQEFLRTLVEAGLLAQAVSR
jgi:hypothetical protein